MGNKYLNNIVGIASSSLPVHTIHHYVFSDAECTHISDTVCHESQQPFPQGSWLVLQWCNFYDKRWGIYNRGQWHPWSWDPWFPHSLQSKHHNSTGECRYNTLPKNKQTKKLSLEGRIFWDPETHINGWVQDCSNPIANALELLQPCTEPSIYFSVNSVHFDFDSGMTFCWFNVTILFPSEIKVFLWFNVKIGIILNSVTMVPGCAKSCIKA